MQMGRDDADSLPWWGIVWRGMAMGAADVVPGVSGGTMALVLGIYARFILALRNIDVDLLKSALAFVTGGFAAVPREALLAKLKEKDTFFLMILGGGIVTSIASFAKVIPWLMDQYPAHMNGLFFGMILASVLVPLRLMGERGLKQVAAFVLSTVSAYVFTSLPVFEMSHSLPFLFLSGTVAICAMLLPGVSGSFLLLVLGQYKYILSALRDLNIPVVVVFSAGCGVGLLGFSRFLSWLFRTYPATTMASLAGLMVGSLQKIWPYKLTAEAMVVDGKVLSAGRNVLPFDPSYSGDALLPGLLLLAGAALAYGLERLGHTKEKPAPSVSAG